MRFGWPRRLAEDDEDDRAKASASGTRVIWAARVVTAPGASGMRPVDTSVVCGGSGGMTEAGSNLIDMRDRLHELSIYRQFPPI